MRKIIAVSIIGAALAWAQHSVAAPTTVKQMQQVMIGGVKASCGLKASEKDDEASIGRLAGSDGINITRFSTGDGKKILAAINAMEPVSTITAEQVIAYKADKETVLAIVNGGRFCILAGAVPNAAFEKTEDRAFGAGT